MRLIDADALYKQTAEWEAEALIELDKVNEKREWERLMAVLAERTAFKHDVADAPTIEAEPTRHGHWIKVGCSFYGVSRYECSVCHYTDEHNESREVPYCWQCGARMENDGSK